MLRRPDDPPTVVATKAATCSHMWVAPNAPPIRRVAIAPVMGGQDRQMQPDTTYRCQRCGLLLVAAKGRW